MKRKILYIMHVDWKWIKQRPHFLAENLAKDSEVLVFYKYSLRRSNLVRNKTNVKKFPLFSLPFKRSSYVSKINSIFQKNILRIAANTYKPDIIWLTHPELLTLIQINGKHKLVYDCMDDSLGFDQNIIQREKIEILEKQLLQRADIVYASSYNLAKKLQDRGCDRNKIYVIKNAFDGRIPIPEQKDDNRVEKAYKIGYLGTISDWIDWETLVACLTRMPALEFHLIGPSDSKQIPQVRRLYIHQSIDHSQIYTEMAKYDCLIVPFKLNELTVSVDPVKLYEYINCGRNIISIFYDELCYFRDFVYFYSSVDELENIIRNLMTSNTLKYTNKQRVDFLKLNTWEQRTGLIYKSLESGLNGRVRQIGSHILYKSEQPKVYIIVLNWNGWKDTIECLESLQRLKYNNYSILVVDNASIDGSMGQIRDWADGSTNLELRSIISETGDKRVNYIEYDRISAEAGGIDEFEVELQDLPANRKMIFIQTGSNLGFAGGNNVGIRYALAKGDLDYLWILNNDTVVDEYALAELVIRTGSDDQIGICGSMLRYYYRPNEIQVLGGAVYCKLLGTSRNIVNGTNTEVEKKLSYISGASMMISKGFIDKVGLMNEEYFLYFEELDWAARNQSFKLAYASNSIVYHKEGASLGSNIDPQIRSQKAEYYLFRNKIVFTRKYLPWALPTVYAGMALSALLRVFRGQKERALMIINIMFNA